jgi:signal transduction histidine kinase
LALHKNVPSHIRRNLYLIYKEAITNIAKHSNGSAVHIQLQKIEATGLEMRIHDNGIPLQKEYKTTGAGLANMRMRAEQIGASLQLDVSSGFLIIIHLLRIS